MTSPSISCSQTTPRTALQFDSSNDQLKYLAINPSDDNTWCAIMSTPSSLLAFFHTGKLCLGSMVHLEFLLTTLCLISSGFLANLFLISFFIQNRLRENHCLRSPSFCTVCRSLSFEKVTVVKWRSEKGKKGSGMNRLLIKIMVLKFCSSCYLRLLAAPDKILEHLCKSCDNRKPCLVL